MRIVKAAVAGVGLAIALAGSARAINVRPNIPEGNITIGLRPVVSYMPSLSTEFTPIDMVAFPDGTGRKAISTVLGTIRVMDANDVLLPTPLLTRAQSVPNNYIPQEAGMTGIAFHPDFGKQGTFGFGKLYTISPDRPSSQTGSVPQSNVDFPFVVNPAVNENYQDVIREWDLATFGGVPGNVGNGAFTGTTANSREVMRVDQPGPFHNVVDMTFNSHSKPGDPDYGLLYITSGDGGDASNESNTATRRRLGAQSLNNIYGKILRIDPNPNGQPIQRTSANSGQPSYSIPTINPFAADDATETRTSPTLAEVYAYGFRSNWRIEFDRATGDLWEGDVGENTLEEINKVVAGGNYGWGQMEGTADGILPGDGRTIPGLIRPVIEIDRNNARSVSGGFIYRGSAIPALQGKYVFADLGQGFTTAALLYASVDPLDPLYGQEQEFKFDAATPLFSDGTTNRTLPLRIYSFGENDAGELYFMAGPDPRSSQSGVRGPAFIVKLVGVPEPSGVALAGVALASLVTAARRRGTGHTATTRRA